MAPSWWASRDPSRQVDSEEKIFVMMEHLYEGPWIPGVFLVGKEVDNCIIRNRDLYIGIVVNALGPIDPAELGQTWITMQMQPETRTSTFPFPMLTQ
jgi:hypothetical protein